MIQHSRRPATARSINANTSKRFRLWWGGIGGGAIQFDGSAEPAIWQIACNYNEPRIEDSFLAIRAQAQGGKPIVRALQTKSVGPFTEMDSLHITADHFQFDAEVLMEYPTAHAR